MHTAALSTLIYHGFLISQLVVVALGTQDETERVLSHQCRLLK